jgi:hypothetical protein
MAESHVVSGLVAKRSELSGLVNFHKAEIVRLNQEIKMLGETIKLFDPDYKVQSIKTKHIHKNNAFFTRNEAGRTILDMLRISGKPLSTSYITTAIMDKKGIHEDKRTALQATLINTLHKMKKKGLIQIVSIDKRNCYFWELIDKRLNIILT